MRLYRSLELDPYLFNFLTFSTVFPIDLEADDSSSLRAIPPVKPSLTPFDAISPPFGYGP